MLPAPSVSPSRRSVLDVIKRAGEASADQVAELLDITVAGARQHLSALSDEGLVVTREVPRAKGERGRPQLMYALSARAEPLFPKAYAELANDLLRYVEAEGEDLVDRVFTRRRDARIDNARARLGRKRSFAARVAELAKILDEDGYLADWEKLPDGTFRITEHNCAVLSVAQHHPSACRSEIEFLQTVLPEADVERVSHIIAGAHQCAYVVTPRDLPEAAVALVPKSARATRVSPSA